MARKSEVKVKQEELASWERAAGAVATYSFFGKGRVCVVMTRVYYTDYIV